MTALAAANAAAVRGEQTARLYEKYGRQLYRYCLARLGSADEAEDAVQRTFSRAHAALASGAAPRFEAAWLYRLARESCVSPAATTAHAHSHADAVGRAAALASLPKNVRDAIVLREWQGLSNQEIAASLNTTVPAVEALVFRARRHLGRAADAETVYGGVRVLLARLRGMLAAAGPAKLALGAAVLALGGTVAAADVAAPDTNRSPSPAPVAAVPAAAPALRAPAPVAAPAKATRRTRAPAAVVRAIGSTAAVVAPSPRPARAPAVATPAVQTPVATVTAPAPSVPVPAVEPPLPAATLRTATVPPVTVPSLPVPSVTVPSVTVPSAPALPVTPP